MSKQNFRKWTIFLTMLQIAYISFIYGIEDFGRFVSKLKEDIKVSRENRTQGALADYKLLRLVNDKIGTLEFYTYCRTMLGIKETEEMITIINIRNTDITKYGTALDFLDSFVQNMQKHLEHDENHPFFDYSGLTVNYIDKAFIKDFDSFNSTTKQINNIFDYLNTLVIENLPEIICAALKEILISDMRRQILGIYNEKIAKKDFSEIDPKCNSKIIAQTTFEHIFNRLTYGPFVNLTFYSFDACSIVNAMNFKIEKYENDAGMSYFSNKLELIQDFLSYQIQVAHKELFEEAMSELVKQLFYIINQPKNKQKFTLLIQNACTELNQCFKDLSAQNLSQDKKAYSIALQKHEDVLSENRKSVSSFDDFFDEIKYGNNVQKLRTKYQTRNDEILAELSKRKYTQILFNGLISISSLHKLSRILEETKALEKTTENQHICISIGSSITTQHLQSCIERKIWAPDTKLVQIFSTIKSSQMDYSMHRSKLIMYESNSVKAFLENQITLDDKSQIIDKMSVCVINCKDLGTSMTGTCTNPQITAYLKRLTDNLLNLCIVSVVNAAGVSYVYIVHQISQYTLRKCYTFIFDLPISETTRLDTICHKTNRSIEYVKDAPDSYLPDLHSYLQFILLSPKAEFKVPNLWLIDNRKIIYTSKYIKISSMCFFYDPLIKNELGIIDRKYTYLSHITVKAIIEYANGLPDAYHPDLTKFVEKLGISEPEFNQIIYELMLGKSDKERPMINNDAIDRYSNVIHKIMLVSKKQFDGSTTLHVCEIRKNNSIHSLMFTLQRGIEKFLEDKKHVEIIKQLTPQFNYFVLRKVFEVMRYNKTFLNDYNIFKDQKLLAEQLMQEYDIMIEQNFTKVSNDFNVLTKAKTQDIRGKYANEYSVKQWIDFLLDEFANIGKMSVIKITSIKIVEPEDKQICEGIKNMKFSDEAVENEGINHPEYGESHILNRKLRKLKIKP